MNGMTRTVGALLICAITAVAQTPAVKGHRIIKNEPSGALETAALCAGAVCSAALPKTRAEQLAGITEVTPSIETQASYRVDAQKTEQFDLGSSWPAPRVGSSGTGPCVGMIVWSPQTVTASHFWVGKDDPKSTLQPLNLGSDVKVYLFGGDDSHSSNQLLGSVLSALKEKGIKVSQIKYSPTDALWIDKDATPSIAPTTRKSASSPGW